MADSGRMEAPRGPWSGWEAGFKDAHSKALGKSFEGAIKKLKLPAEEERCIADMARLMQRLYANLPPRNDGTLPIAHILRVATRLAGHKNGGYGIRDANIILAALAHDGVEDHAETLARLGKYTGTDNHGEALEYVGKTFGAQTKQIVEHTTHVKTLGALTREEKIAGYVEYVSGVTEDPRALLVKISDVCDNIDFPSPEIQQRTYSMEKYWNALPVLQAGLEKHKEFIMLHGGPRLYLKITADLIKAKRKAARWVKPK